MGLYKSLLPAQPGDIANRRVCWFNGWFVPSLISGQWFTGWQAAGGRAGGRRADDQQWCRGRLWRFAPFERFF